MLGIGLRRNAIFALAVGFALMVPSGPASALSEADILGTWCGAKSNSNLTNYTITRNTLTVTYFPANTQRVFPITSFDFSSDVVTMNWKLADNDERWTKFGEFSPDRRSMMQLASEAGPRYDFYRCSPSAASAPAASLAYADILGKWCGSRNNPNITNYTFTRNQLTVQFLSNDTKKVFEIENFEFTDTVITMNWKLNAKDRRWTKFEFLSNRSILVQLPNEAGPRYEFSRC